MGGGVSAGAGKAVSVLKGVRHLPSSLKPPAPARPLPVTLGSNVPLCPVLSTSRSRLIHATTSCEEGFEGLSRFRMP